MSIKEKIKETVTVENVKKAGIWVGKKVVGVVCVCFARELGIDATIGRSYRYDRYSRNLVDDIPSIFMADSVQDRAILSIYNSAKTMNWDSDKVRAARSIAQKAIASKNDHTARLAIDLLDSLSATMDWDSDREKITAMISAIADADVEEKEDTKE